MRGKAWVLAIALGGMAAHLAAAPAAADAKAGERIAMAGTPAGGTACASCHGQRGEGMAAFPRLGGVGAAYLQQQLDAFADGTRKNAIMQPIAQGLTPQQRIQVAAYFSSLPKPAAVQDGAARTPSDTGAWLATRGRWDEGIPACAQCHGPGGVGVGENFPPLAGQPAGYLADQLKAWQSGARHPGPLGLMESIARKLKPADVQAVSDYYAGLASKAAAATAAAGRARAGGSTP
ncbi:MAG: c-type cytochrome [Comamonadaceae bacterium]|nr:MAG: c-type cytochrome [Comamonadaceae bacterium]